MKHTNQTFFNAVWERARDKRKSISSGRCLYRGNDGLRCFVGVCIPDGEYRKGFEEMHVRDVSPLVPSLAGVNPGLLVEVQFIHDAVSEGDWESHLRELAEEHGLEVPA